MYLNQFFSIKKIEFFYKRKAGGMLSMLSMLNILKLNLVDRHHNGIWDCKNIARIMLNLVV